MLMTEAQYTGVVHALATVIGGDPEAFFGWKANVCAVGEALYTFMWIKDGVFGKAEVLRPAEDDSKAAPTTCWIRPLSDIRKIEVGFDVTNGPVVVSEFTVKQKATVHWDGESVTLDATGSMNSYSRPELEKLIDLVLGSIRTETVLA